jgi:hypothetical protein
MGRAAEIRQKEECLRLFYVKKAAFNLQKVFALIINPAKGNSR